MMRVLCFVAAKTLLVISILTLTLNARATDSDSVHVAVASNFTSTFIKLKTHFENASGHRIKVSYGSSGVLYAQIHNGAPFDVFLSADSERPDKLIRESLASRQHSFIYAKGQLALWTGNTSVKTMGEQTLKQHDTWLQSNFKLAIANPKLAPYGRASVETLISLNVPKDYRKHLIYGQNIAQTYQFVVSGTVNAGFIALSQILSMPEQQRGIYWIVPSSYHSSIHQKAVLLNQAKQSVPARQFLDFLQSEIATQIISKSGYLTDASVEQPQVTAL